MHAFARLLPLSQLAACSIHSCVWNLSTTANRAFCQEILPQHDFNVSPGAALRIQSDARTHACVKNGDIERIAILVESGDIAAVYVSHKEVHGRKTIDVHVPKSASVPRITAWVPPRWCSVDVAVQGGDVSIEKVVEASVHVATGGGSATIQLVRSGGNAMIDTRAALGTSNTQITGSVSIGEIGAADVQISGGGVSVRRLVGKDVQVSTCGDGLDVDVLYAENVSMSSGGGPISIGSMDCSGESVIVASSGGAIRVGSLNSNATLKSQGGDVEVHLHSKVGEVVVHSGGGAVRCAVDPSTDIMLSLRGAAGVHMEPHMELTGQCGAEMVEGMLAAASSHNPNGGTAAPGRLLAQPSAGRLDVDAGSGSVTLRTASWADMVMAKMKGRRTQP